MTTSISDAVTDAAPAAFTLATSVPAHIQSGPKTTSASVSWTLKRKRDDADESTPPTPYDQSIIVGTTYDGEEPSHDRTQYYRIHAPLTDEWKAYIKNGYRSKDEKETKQQETKIDKQETKIDQQAPDKPSPKLAPTVQWTIQHRNAFEVAMQIARGEVQGMLVTGGGGVGKTFWMNKLIEILKNLNKTVEVVSYIGTAASLVEGKTINSFMGISPSALKSPMGIHKVEQEYLKNKSKQERWALLDVLVIDEISTVEPKLFILMDRVARICRGKNRPFGGLPVIVCGDFYQLPPVKVVAPAAVAAVAAVDVKKKLLEMDKHTKSYKKKTTVHYPSIEYTRADTQTYCFETKTWSELFPDERCIIFYQSFRQLGWINFTNCLNDLREGNVTKRAQQMLQRSCQKTMSDSSSVERSKLFVEMQLYMGDPLKWVMGQLVLVQPPRILLSCYRREVDERNNEKWNFECVQPNRLPCRSSAWITFHQRPKWETVKSEWEARKGLMSSRQQAKMRAIIQSRPTREEIQDRLTNTISFPGMFPCEQHVDLCIGARVLLTMNLNTKMGLTNGASGIIIGFVLIETEYVRQRAIKDQCSVDIPITRIIPLIQFDRGNVAFIFPVPIMEECRTGWFMTWQLPLKLAYAITIHKCQGMTLKTAEMNIRNAFEFGQAYVACSRVSSEKDLWITQWDMHTSFKVHPKVTEFYKRIDTRKKIDEELSKHWTRDWVNQCMMYM